METAKLKHKRFEISGFTVTNTVILILAALVCFLPFLHMLAVSLSNKAIVAAGEVRFWPKGFTTSSYIYVLKLRQFWRSFMISVARLAIGVSLNLIIVILSGYPLSKESGQFRSRTAYAWFFFFPMLFNGGLIPLYVVINTLGIMDSIWALVLPRGTQIFLVLLMLNFFRQIPKELEDSAVIDGAGKWRTMARIYVPLSLPAIATMTLFSAIFHWNSWFDGLIYINRPQNYPLQSFLHTVIIANALQLTEDIETMIRMTEISSRTLKSAQIIIAIIPIFAVYPFLQRYFVKGIVLGSVKG